MKEEFYDDSFSVDELTFKINKLMSRWSVRLLDINGPNWIIYGHDMEPKVYMHFEVDFSNIETRIKLEDLKLNVIHHIESLKDDTSYRDNLTNPVFI